VPHSANKILLFFAAFAVFYIQSAARAETVDHPLNSGSTVLMLREKALLDLGIRAEWTAASSMIADTRQGMLTLAPGASLQLRAGADGEPAAESMTWRHVESITLRSAGGALELEGLHIHIARGGAEADILDPRGRRVIALHELRIALDPPGNVVLIESAGLALTDAGARALQLPKAAGVPFGYLVSRATFGAADVPDGGTRAVPPACGQTPGPDVIVGDLPAMSAFGSVGGVAAFAVGTTSCNVGGTELLWIIDQNKHPVIAQNLYRLKDGRFEQIGMSWLKHGFSALTGNLCGCGCQDPGTSQRLGVGCSDPYSSGLNGNQFFLGPRSEVNPHTGDYPYPYTSQNVTGDAIFKRLQVRVADLDPAQQGGGLYFAEGQYVTPDDASAGNGDNNASYRQANIAGAGMNWTASFAGMPATVRGAPAIRAWRAHDPSVVLTDVRVPNEGLVLLAARAEALGGGMWHYEYAVQNLNSDRAVGSFTIPVATAAVVQNIGFHDVDYHSGETYDGADWLGMRDGDSITWMTDPYDVNSNANALRWGSLYNFRFDADLPPLQTSARLGLFKPGKPGDPDAVVAQTVGPPANLLDCNTNGVADVLDISAGVSQDCNTNGLPDECEDFTTLRLAAVEVAAGLDSPVSAAAPPNDPQRLFICEQLTGRIRILDDGVLRANPFLDIGALITAGGERGLLGIAFHPEYAANGHFFVYYTNLSGDTVVARYTASNDPDLADAGSALILKTIPQDTAFHHGGQLAFGPDGHLYVATGDGGAAGDALNRAQDVNSLLGKILRLDVDGPAPYIPADNPFVGSGGLDEIWALGLRNPWRFSFDRLTGDLYIADVGESSREEINLTPAAAGGGQNYGWRCYEGALPFNLAGCGPDSTYEFPILEYPHADGACAVIGGYVYRGCALPGLRGTYFFADYCAGWVRTFRLSDADPPAVQDRTFELGNIDGQITAFAEDAAGELFLLTTAGKVYRISAAPEAGICGDNVIGYAEQCDDGNTSFGDGCDEHCQIEGAGLDICGGAQALCPDASVAGSTAGAVADGSATCGQAAGSPAHWYVYTPVADGAAAFATCGSTFDTVLSVHSQCPGGAGTELLCNDDGCGPGEYGSRAVISVSAGASYLVRVSGFNGAAGDYVLSVTGPGCSALCGNGVVELGEQCEPPGESGCSLACQFNVCENPIYFEGFESGPPAGWSLHGAGSTASAGAWTVGDPDGTNTGGAFVQPEDAFAGAGCAFTATNASLLDGDVDGGVTWLVSPLYDLSGLGNARVRYARWFYNGLPGDDPGDYFTAQVSANGGASWVTLETLIDQTQASTWVEAAFDLEPLIALTSQVRLRFGVSDGAGVDDLVEGAIDAISLSTCVDCNSNNIDDGQEILAGLATDLNTNGVPDDCEAQGDPLRGGLLYDAWMKVLPGIAINEDHPLWALRPDQTSNPRTGRDTWRCKECHGWDYQGVDGAYATSSHRTGFPGILDTSLSDEDLLLLLASPPNNGGGSGVPNGHDLARFMTFDEMRNLIAFVRVGLVDTDELIDGSGLFIGDPVAGGFNYQTNPAGPSCKVCHGPDGTNIDFGNGLDPVWLGTVAADDPWELLHKVRFGQPGSSMPQYLAFGTTRGAVDIGAYVQQNFPVLCFLDSHCADGNACNGDETCGASGCAPGVYPGCAVSCDDDCDLDLGDFALLQRCYTGPGPAVYPPGCACYDRDTDGDIDAADHAAFIMTLSGADVPAAGCEAP